MQEKLICVTSENIILGNQKQETMILIYILQKTFWDGKNSQVLFIVCLGCFGKIFCVHHFKYSKTHSLARINGRERGDPTINVNAHILVCSWYWVIPEKDLRSIVWWLEHGFCSQRAWVQILTILPAVRTYASFKFFNFLVPQFPYVFFFFFLNN